MILETNDPGIPSVNNSEPHGVISAARSFGKVNVEPISKSRKL
jgi:hypothetical protein